MPAELLIHSGQFAPPSTAAIIDKRLPIDPTKTMWGPPQTRAIIDKRLPINPTMKGDPFAGVDDPFAGFDFSEMQNFDVDTDKKEPINLSDLSRVWEKRKEEVVVAMTTLSAAAAANCVCPPQKLSNGRIIHGEIVNLFEDSPSRNNSPEPARGLMVTTGCKPGYVHVYQPDGTYIEMKQTVAETLFEVTPTAQKELMTKMGFSEKEMVSWAAAMQMGGVQRGGHVESGCCAPSGTLSFSRGSGVSSAGPSALGGGGRHSHSAENHDDHEHCSCGGHFEGGKCGKCGKTLQTSSS